MSRRRSRVSRPLIGVMVLTVGVGAGVWYARSGKKAEAKATGPSPAAPVAAAKPAADPAEAGALVMSAPAKLMAAPETPPAAAAESTGDGTPAATQPVAAASTQPATAAKGTETGAAAGPVVLPAGASAALTEGKGLIDAGELVAGRKVLNEALLSGALSGSDADVARRLMSEANKAIVFSPRRFPADTYQGTHTVQAGEKLQKIAYGEGVTWEFMCRINGLSDPRRMRAGATMKTVQGPFHAVVTKGTYTMDLYLGSPGRAGSMYVTSLPVGLGANDSTPTGTWTATGKLKNPAYFSPRGEGIIAADDPKNPLGEFWIGLQGVEGEAVGKMSYGIHGTIEPETIGQQSSLGCIRLRAEDIALVYELLVEGRSTVVVKE